MVASIRLPDSSTVWLNANTVISYPQKFNKERLVKLDGEAFFDVTKNPEKKFKVQTPAQAAIEVLGTRFNVDAYHTDSTVRATLEEGSVRFNYQSNTGSKSLLLKPSQTIVYNIKNQSIVPNALNEKTLTSWKDNQIVLKNTSLTELLTIISKRFNVKFNLKSAKLNEERFTGVFDSQQLITDWSISKYLHASNILSSMMVAKLMVRLLWNSINKSFYYVNNKILLIQFINHYHEQVKIKTDLIGAWNLCIPICPSTAEVTDFVCQQQKYADNPR